MVPRSRAENSHEAYGFQNTWISFSRGLFSWTRLVFRGIFFVHDNHRSLKMDHFETTHLPGPDFHVHDHILGKYIKKKTLFGLFDRIKHFEGGINLM